MTYSVAQLEEIDEIVHGSVPWRAVRHHFGITAFAVNAWTGRDAGDRMTVEEYGDPADSNGHEVLYLVQRGRATFELDGERVDAPAGTLVFARPVVKRAAIAEEPGTTILAVGGTPGRPYEPDGWEVWAPLARLYRSGEYVEVADRLPALIEANPEYPDLVYNLACCESLAGRATDAIEHLRLAIAQAERYRSLAAGDSDFDPIREEPAFKELIAG